MNWRTQGPRGPLPQAAISVYCRHPVTPGCDAMVSSPEEEKTEEEEEEEEVEFIRPCTCYYYY